MFYYLQYILKSTNAHGVHSPFVYNLVTQCIYLRKTMFLPLKTMFVSNKYQQLEQRLFEYFKPKSILNLSKETLQTKGAVIVSEIEQGIAYDVVYMEISNLGKMGLPKVFASMHKNSMLMVKKNQTEENLQLWKQLKENNQVTVTVDLYALGLVFFRKEQVKQNFIIRF